MTRFENPEQEAIDRLAELTRCRYITQWQLDGLRRWHDSLDDYHRGHVSRVALLTTEEAKQRGLDEGRALIGGFAHDNGKIIIARERPELIDMDRVYETAEERETMDRHSTESAIILYNLGLIEPSYDAFCHHLPKPPQAQAWFDSLPQQQKQTVKQYSGLIKKWDRRDASMTRAPVRNDLPRIAYTDHWAA